MPLIDSLRESARPVVEMFTLCRSVEIVDGGLNITAASARFLAGLSSVVVPQVTVVASLRFPLAQEGPHVYRISVMDLHGAEVTLPAMGTMEVTARGNDVYAWMQFSAVIATPQFNQPGDFRFDLTIDGEPAANCWLCVVRP